MTATNTSLVLPERVPALLAIYADLIRLAADMIPEYVRGGRKLSFHTRREHIESHTIWSVDSNGETIEGVPFVAHVAFGGKRQRVGWIIEQEMNGDVPVVGEDGKPKYLIATDYDLVISGKADLPDPRNPTERISCEARPLRTTNGLGSLIEYVYIDEVSGAIRAGEPMLCIFIRDFDPHTGIENGGVRAIPLGLARKETIGRWNTVVARLLAQDPRNAWQSLTPIENNIGRAVEYLELQPQGPESMQGLTPVYKSQPSDPKKFDYAIVARLGGKVAQLNKESPRIIFQGQVPANQLFLVSEKWNAIGLKVWGLPGEVKSLEMRELDMGEVKMDALALLSATLYDVHPGSGGALVGRAIRTPPIDYMVGNGWLVPGTTEEMARTTLQGMGRLVRDRVREQVQTARRDITHALGMGGAEAVDKPTLAEILGGEKSSEALRTAMQQSEGDCPLASWMLASSTVQNLGLATWDWNCWVLRESRKDLIMELARSQGLELPPKPAEPPEGGGDGGGEAAAEPTPDSSPEASAKGEVTTEGNGTGKVKLPKRERKPRGKKAKAEGEGITT
ncbi:hypothetical protein HZA87_03765 [Candidatus Uhrbacteria bacterium]|nr:hypothetical protein [Candidatus Uhrbacteria bacterium]